MAEMTTVRPKLPTRSVVVLVPARGQLIGVMGFAEAFDAANRFAIARGRAAPYTLRTVGLTERTASVSGPVLCTEPSHQVDFAHTLVVGGTLDGTVARVGDRFRDEVARLAKRSERVVGLCAGTFALAEAGLLDGCPCTTHWLATADLQRRFRSAKVESDALFTEHEGRLYTSAGATAGIDLALHLIRGDLGRRMALAVARALVVFAQRPGGQSQFGSGVRLPAGVDDRLAEVLSDIVEDPGRVLSVEVLARQAGMSPRHFARVFRKSTGETPAAYVTRVRVEAAQRALAYGDASLAAVACACGFETEDGLRRAFRRVAGVTPSAYKQRFRV